MTEPDSATPTGPYAAAAATYWAAGWRGILPLPSGQKAPVPTGWTGRDGAWPSFADIHAWTEERGSGNIALRLPPGVLGIDVDHYGSKPGGAVLADWESRLASLPATWRTTSRDDGISGIRLYRIPEGLRWPGVLGPGIETIRTEHRYAATWPSLHPGGSTYRWITPDGATALTDVPNVDDLPDLPAAWVEHFTKGELSTDQPRADLDDSAASEWLRQRGELLFPCRAMKRALERSLADLLTGASRHDAALSGTNRIVWLAGEGHPGQHDALADLREAFLKATSGDRNTGDAEAEWDRMVTGAVRMAAAAHPTTDGDPCDDPFAGLINRKEQPWTSASSSSSPTMPPPSQSTTTPSASTKTTPSASTKTSPAPSASTEEEPSATSASTESADDVFEQQIKRNQAAAQEVERLRAQRAAQRILEREDEEATIADRVRRRILDDKATAEYKRITEPPAPPFDAGTLADILARPADPPMRIDGLIPWSGSSLVVAQRKTGKTTLMLNYARSLLTGEQFLGEFGVIPVEQDAAVAMLNFEVSAAQLARWADDCAVPSDRFFMVNLRGRRNPLGHADDRAALAAVLRERNVQAVIVDPFGRAYTGVSQNDNGEVQAFLVGLEQFVRSDVGALDLMLATHAGWDGERTRGASALEDWGDVIITLTRDAEDDSKRFMKAMGRDVDIDEDELVMDPLTRYLSRTGNGGRNPRARNQAKIEKLAVGAVRVIRDNPGCSRADVKRALSEMDDMPLIPRGGAGEELVTSALKHAERVRSIRCETAAQNGGKNAYFEVTTPTTPDHSSTTPGVVTNHHHSSTLYRSGGGEHGADLVERTVAGERMLVNLVTGEAVKL